jgi:hypothetical protein
MFMQQTLFRDVCLPVVKILRLSTDYKYSFFVKIIQNYDFLISRCFLYYCNYPSDTL